MQPPPHAPAHRGLRRPRVLVVAFAVGEQPPVPRREAGERGGRVVADLVRLAEQLALHGAADHVVGEGQPAQGTPQGVDQPAPRDLHDGMQGAHAAARQRGRDLVRARSAQAGGDGVGRPRESGRGGIHSGEGQEATDGIELARLHGVVAVAVDPVVGERRARAERIVEGHVPRAQRAGVGGVAQPRHHRAVAAEVPRDPRPREQVPPADLARGAGIGHRGKEVGEGGIGLHGRRQVPPRQPLQAQAESDPQPSPPRLVLRVCRPPAVHGALALGSGGHREPGEVEGAEEDGLPLVGRHHRRRRSRPPRTPEAGARRRRRPRPSRRPPLVANLWSRAPHPRSCVVGRGRRLDPRLEARAVGVEGLVRALEDAAEILVCARGRPALRVEAETGVEVRGPRGEGDAPQVSAVLEGHEARRPGLPPPRRGGRLEAHVAVLVHLLRAQGQERDRARAEPGPHARREVRRPQALLVAGEGLLSERVAREGGPDPEPIRPHGTGGLAASSLTLSVSPRTMEWPARAAGRLRDRGPVARTCARPVQRAAVSRVTRPNCAPGVRTRTSRAEVRTSTRARASMSG